MRILHILWRGEIGGAERAVFQLAQAQARQPDFDVAVAFGRAKGPYVDRLRAAGIEVIDLKLRSSYDIAALPRIRSALSGFDIHHFHVAEPMLMFASTLIPGARRCFTYRAGNHRRPKKQILRFLPAKFLIKFGFHGISANTDHAGRAAEAQFGLPPLSVTTTYNGLNFDLLEPTVSRDDARQAMGVVGDDVFLIGTVSNLKMGKRIDWLIRAAAGLKQTGWRLAIVGDGSARASLEEIANGLGVGDKTTFVGRQVHVADWLVGFDAFVLPSDDSESFGNAAVEAMALGIPTIVFRDGGGLVEHIVDGQSGWLADGVDGLTRCLERLLADRSAARQVGEAGRQTVRQKYSVDRMVAAYNRFYEVSGVRAPSIASASRQ